MLDLGVREMQQLPIAAYTNQLITEDSLYEAAKGT